ncbi:thiamine pyrophosphate-dependent enzyme [Alphaproteobacteria bacterium]|nr:thiamine pyrophosphate-dependent enzyme [Alphaproteobacteria bacterium]
MPKQLSIEPDQTYAASTVRFADIQVHSYQPDLALESKRWGSEKLRRALHDMLMLREFESMLNSFKMTGSYRDIQYGYNGPAHLSVGQEAVAVGSAMALTPTDQIFGSHRSHGEILAKGLGAIAEMDDVKVETIIKEHDRGRLSNFVENHIGDAGGRPGEAFLLAGMLAEVFMRDVGFNKGMGGSMHAFFTPFGAYPNNAIVGGSAGIAVGAALRAHLTGSENIVLANLGDGSTGCGLVWESMNFASMGQFTTLWEKPFNRRPPVLFSFTNNFYAMGGQTRGETMAWDRLSRIGAGISPEQLHAETVNGSNPLAVADAVDRKAKLLRAGEGPALLDFECYRYSGHSTTDTNSYRSRDELKAWQAHDPIILYQEHLIKGGLITIEEVETMAQCVAKKVEAVTRAVVDRQKAPAIDLNSNPTLIGEMTFNGTRCELNEKASDLLINPADSKIVQSIERKSRTGIDEEGKTLSPMRAVTFRDAISEGILYHLIHDESLIAYGEECRDWGGAFGVHRGFSDIIPYNRLFNSPISEAAIVSTAVGYALSGGRALIELMYADFIGRAGDEIFNQLAKWQAMSAGELQLPVVLRTSVGSKYGAQHSQDWSSLVTHIPGIRVVYPATPSDAKGLMMTALSSNDPTIFFESQRLYEKVDIFEPNGVPKGKYDLEFGQAVVRRVGVDATILTIGPSLYPSLDAARELSLNGIEVEIIDARTLVPFDYETILASVIKTGRLIIVSEAVERGSFANTVSANITRLAFNDLKAAPIVLGAPNWIAPGADMEDSYSPQPYDICDTILIEFFSEKRVNRRGKRGWDIIDMAKRGI